MINNPNLSENLDDNTIINLYHLDIYENRKWLEEHFGDVKVVCMGGKASRMKELAKEWKAHNNPEVYDELIDYSGKGDRFSMFKENRVIFLSHGMGIPSVSIALNEVTILLHFSGVSDAIFIRIGTCGGLDLTPGTMVVTEQCFDCNLQNYLEMFVCGKSVKRPALLDKNICEEFITLSKKHFEGRKELKIVKANTLCANDFYEEQARMDGAFNEITSENKFKYFDKLIKEYNIRNIEMESLGFAAFCHNLNIKGIVVALILVDRLKSDFVTLTHEEIKALQETLNEILINYINHKLENK